MKADRIIFGAACLGLGYLCHTALNPSQNAEPLVPQKVTENMPKMKPELTKDTVLFQDCIKKDSVNVLKDSLKFIKK